MVVCHGEARSGAPEERLADAYHAAFSQRLAGLEAVRREDENRGPVAEVAEFVALPHPDAARGSRQSDTTNARGPRQTLEVDTRDKNRRDGDERHRTVGVRWLEVEHHAFVLAEQVLDAFERDGVHVPRLAGNPERRAEV